MVYDRIKAIATEQNITICRLEKQAQIGNGVIAGWKKYKPRADLLKRVADVLGTTMDELIKEP